MLGANPLSTRPISAFPAIIAVNGIATGEAFINANSVAQFLSSASISVVGSVQIDTTLIVFVDLSANGIASVNADFLLTAMAEASVTSVAIVNLDTVGIFVGASDMNGLAMVDVDTQVIFTVESDVNGNASTVITAELVGENWSLVPEGTNIWLRRG